MLYGVILLLVGGISGWVVLRIYHGDVSLIHDYHQTKVKDKCAYGKAFGRALGILAAGILLSGVLALLGDSEIWLYGSLAILLLGLGAGTVCLCRVQKQYNGGVF